ncbi:MAG TPA: spore germination protein GerW family protein [Anaerolineales bacterium]|nr:spore germination protein GerW family protein [Anaerolineales bacterium]
MTDEMKENPPVEAGLEMYQDTMEEFLAAADVRVVYGEPIQHDDTLIIPTAEVLCGMGFGVGSGSGTSTENPDKPAQGSGSGGGGGGRILSRPVAVIVASPEGVRVEPVVDITKIALAALTALGFMVGMMFRMSSRRHAFPSVEE